MGEESWERHSQRWDQATGHERPNPELLAGFVRRLRGQPPLWQELCEVSEAFRGVTGDPPTALSRRRYQLVGQLRRQLGHLMP